MCFRKVMAVLVLISFEIIVNTKPASSVFRQRRSLIFPPTTPTRLQFICGIGIPVEDLHYESVTSGYVLKAEYFLPTNATELYRKEVMPQTIHRRSVHKYEPEVPNRSKINQNDLSTYRWIIYKAMEQLADSMGLVGRACVLKSICEVANIPFHHASGILAEVAHIVMTPSSSIDVIQHHSSNEYRHAEMLGRSGAACSFSFPECPQSLIEHASTVLRMSRKIFSAL